MKHNLRKKRGCKRCKGGKGEIQNKSNSFKLQMKLTEHAYASKQQQ